MGCDIHLYHERRAKGSQQWEPTYGEDHELRAELLDDYKDAYPEEYEHYAALPAEAKESPSERHYYGFAALGLTSRGYLDTPLELKGMPEDVSPAVDTAYQRWDVDGHSHSWLTLKEMKEAIVVSQVKNSSDLAAGLRYYIDALEQLEKEQPDAEHRIVFWFDN